MDDLLNSASAENGLTLTSFLLGFVVRSNMGEAFKADSFLRLSPPTPFVGVDLL